MHLRAIRTAACLSMLLAVATTIAAPGDLDASFAGDGKLRFGFGGGGGAGYDVLVQADGKAVTAGTASTGGDTAFALVRYNPDGSFDSSFGDAGLVLTNFASAQPAVGGTGLDEAHGVAIQADGKIVAAGHTRNGSDTDFAVARYNADGSLDPSFGSQGKVTTSFGSNVDFAWDIAVQADGKIVVAGTVQGNFAVARYNANGSLDGDFGSGGKVVMTALFSGSAFGAHLALQADGKILVAGSPSSGIAQAFYLVRLNSNGSYDATFGNGGLAARGVGTSGGLCTGMAIQSATIIGDSHKIVLAGYAYNGTREVLAILRFNDNGTLDSSFDGDGELTSDLAGVANGTVRPTGVSIEGNRFQRKIVVTGQVSRPSGGSTAFQSFVVRYHGDGSPDTTWDGDGIVAFDAIRFVEALAISGGKIVAAGGGQGRFIAMRFDSNGSFDASFDGDGVRVDEIGSDPSRANGVAIQADAKVVVAGTGGNFGANFAVARLNPDGSFDNSFGGDGRVSAELLTDAGNAVALQSDGKILVAGARATGTTAGVDAAVARYNTDGSADTSFGGGVAVSQTPQADVANAIALQSDGKIIVAGSVSNGVNRDVAIFRFHPSGLLDSTFDFDGRVITALGVGHDEARAVAIQPDGRIVVAGSAANAPTQFFVARFHPNGALDSSFDQDGVAFTSVGSGDAIADALVLDSAGRITLAGFCSNGTNYDVAVVRNNPDGSLDTSFGTEGKVITPISAGDDRAHAIALQRDGKLVVAGEADPNLSLGSSSTGPQGSFALVRYLANGTLDETYGTAGKSTFAFEPGGNDAAYAIALDANANAVVAGEAGQLFGVARVQAGPVVPPRFANISTRLRVETGNNVLIGGFIVTGSMQKRIIVRALGPSLQAIAPEERLANPVLELYRGDELIASNDNWQDAPNRQEIFDSTIPPPNDLESAILQNVDLGAYTAIVRGVADRQGVGLVEVYDLGSAENSKLANISTRGRVLTRDNVMIGGLIITGSSPQKVIVRAIGPSLPIGGKLEDPFLELFDGNGTLLTSNNNWKDTQQAEIEATTIPPSNDLESAIVTSLTPAAYTAVVRGVNDTTGVALVEAYALP